MTVELAHVAYGDKEVLRGLIELYDSVDGNPENIVADRSEHESALLANMVTLFAVARRDPSQSRAPSRSCQWLAE